MPPAWPWQMPGIARVFLALSLMSEGARNISCKGRHRGRRGLILCRLMRQHHGSGRRSRESPELGSGVSDGAPGAFVGGNAPEGGLGRSMGCSPMADLISLQH